MNSLKKMILERGSMTDFSRKAGIALPRLSRIANGYLRPGRKTAMKIASFLGIEPEIFNQKNKENNNVE